MFGAVFLTKNSFSFSFLALKNVRIHSNLAQAYKLFLYINFELLLFLELQSKIVKLVNCDETIDKFDYGYVKFKFKFKFFRHIFMFMSNT